MDGVGEASLAGHLCGYLQSRAWSPEGQLCLPVSPFHSSLRCHSHPISLSEHHPHPPACTIFSLLGTGSASPEVCHLGYRRWIIGEKVFIIIIINCKLVI